MKRVASLYLPNLPTDRLRRMVGKGRPGPSPDAPLATIHRSGQRMLLAAVCPIARSLGLNPGIPVTQARALVPGLQLIPADPQSDQGVLEHLAVFAARRWTPLAAISAPDGVWLDLSGVSHLFGGERRMCQHILRFCRRLGLAARIAVAGTTGAAHALARFGGQGLFLCLPNREAEAIGPLPPAALRLEDHAVQSCRRFGIESIDELIGIPRGPLGRRLGSHLLTRLDQALGRIEEPFDPVVPHDPPQVTLRFLEPILSPETIEQVVTDLVAMLVKRLAQQGLGARRISLLCDRIDGEEQALAIGMARATRDGNHLLHLFQTKIPAIEPRFGIEAMHLVATRCERLAPQQIDSDKEENSGLPPLIDRIASRIGSSHVFCCSAVESDVPERSVRRIPALSEACEWPRQWPRPVRLLPRPEPVDKVIAELPDQPPLRFSWRGKMHRVCKADGPERIYGEWWKRRGEADSVRDYFQVEDEGGARFWLFRKGDGENPATGDLSWYVHGIFA